MRAKIIYALCMVSLPPRDPILFDCPAIYQIIVNGKINPTWSDRLEGMQICLSTLEDGSPITTLVGELSDQVALAGVLNSLYELHRTILSVERLKREKEDENH